MAVPRWLGLVGQRALILPRARPCPRPVMCARSLLSEAELGPAARPGLRAEGRRRHGRERGTQRRGRRPYSKQSAHSARHDLNRAGRGDEVKRGVRGLVEGGTAHHSADAARAVVVRRNALRRALLAVRVAGHRQGHAARVFDFDRAAALLLNPLGFVACVALGQPSASPAVPRPPLALARPPLPMAYLLHCAHPAHLRAM